ncbi:M6 family metalloprotease domain-containing protein [Thiolapillus sp.]
MSPYTYLWRAWALSSIGGILLLAAGMAQAVPAAPGEYRLEQADGTFIVARQWGDEWARGWETITGYSIIYDDTRKTWFYARHDASGQLVASATAVRAEDTSGAALKGRTFSPVYQSGKEIGKHLRPSASARANAWQRSTFNTSSKHHRPQQITSVTNIGKLPVLMINYSDTTTTYSAPDFDSLLFSGTWGYTLKDYFEEVSYSQFTVNGAVSGWYTAANPHSFYGANDADDNDSFPGLLVEEAVSAADPAIDFSRYDTDGDCYVDVVAIIHQGTGEEAGGADADIWSHRWSLNAANAWGAGGAGEYTTNDPCSTGGFIKINDYILQPEILFGGQQTIGVFAHEYAHSLGLPDLYDTDDSSSGLGDWALMAGGSWNRNARPGDRPAHMSAWSKYFLGWVTPTPVTGAMTAEHIDAASTAADVYQGGDGSALLSTGEYFLIENRHQSGFDSGLPGSGLAIWHVDEAKATGNNRDNANECIPPADCSVHHYRVSLVQSDNQWHLENKANRGDASDLYANSASGFSAITQPSSNWYNGTASDFSATNISASGITMTADLGMVSSSNGVLRFSSPAIYVDEGVGSIDIAVQRTGGGAGAVSASCTMSNISALSSSDFSISTMSLNWADGDATDKSCTVTIVDDTVIEGAQHFKVGLSAPTGGAVLGAPSTIVVNIEDNETCSGTAVDLSGMSFESGANLDCIATTSILATGGSIAAGSRVGFYSPEIRLGSGYSINGSFSAGTYSVFEGSNTTPLVVGTSSGPFMPYPSTISVSGMNGDVSRVTVTLHDLQHTYLSDIDALLLGPQGQSVLLLADVGGGDSVSGIDLTFDDAASSMVAQPVSTGAYLPTNNGSTAFARPAPPAPYGSRMAALNGSNPNGEWKLFLYDDTGLDAGSLRGGWSIHIEAR